MPVTVDDIANQMLVLLPEDGTPVPDRVMRVMLARSLSSDIDEQCYAEARSRLEHGGLIDPRPGPGRQVCRKPQQPGKPAVTEAPKDGWAEARLMPWLKKYLDGPIRDELDILRGAKCLTCDTSSVGKPGVQWARPDFTLVSVKQFKLLPGVEVDVHSFELKTESGGATDLAVFEALAQTRFTNFGYLVWHLPAVSKFERKLPSIEKQCIQHGIGFIRAREPQDFGTWSVLVDPIRKSTPSAEIDLFLDQRLHDAQREQIRLLLNGSRP